MNNFYGFLLIFILGTICDGSELQVLQGNNVFSSKVYDILSKKDENVIFSPISAHAVLSMAYQGADGDTANAFANALKVPQAQDAAEGYKTLMNQLNNVENVSLSIANKVYVMENQKLLESYKSLLSNNFYSDVQSVNFAEKTESAKTINEWVENKTNNKIKDLIDPNDLGATTRLVLVNAVYFKGPWLHPFKKDNTKTEKFYLNNDDSVDVDMMHKNEYFQYKDDASLNAKILALPYINSDFKMVIILPNERNGINDLGKKVSTVNLTQIVDNLSETNVDVYLPRFKIEQTIDLKDVLSKVGLGIIFDPAGANFSKMIENDDKLFVSKAIQKAFIEVNEEGAEAAAATDVLFSYTSSLGPRKPDPVFKVDHPFVFQVVHKTNPLFMGKIRKL